MTPYTSWDEFVKDWGPDIEAQRRVKERMTATTFADDGLTAHREFVKNHHRGFGEDAFQGAWSLLVATMPKWFSFLEIGVHAGQVTSLIGFAAGRVGKAAYVVGVSPFDGREVHSATTYRDLTERIWKGFCGDDQSLKLIEGDSTDPYVVTKVAGHARFDVVYIDGSHVYENVVKDIENYSPMVRVGGYFVMDDAAMLFPQPFGHFCGIADVCRAADERLPPKTPHPDFEHVGNVDHLRFWKRVR